MSKINNKHEISFGRIYCEIIFYLHISNLSRIGATCYFLFYEWMWFRLNLLVGCTVNHHHSQEVTTIVYNIKNRCKKKINCTQNIRGMHE